MHLQSFVSSFPLKTAISYSYCTPSLTDNYTYTLGAQQQNNYILPSPGQQAQQPAPSYVQCGQASGPILFCYLSCMVVLTDLLGCSRSSGDWRCHIPSLRVL